MELHPATLGTEQGAHPLVAEAGGWNLGERTLGSSPHGRKIIHIDMDCFFAAVEVLSRPELAERPVAVGGSPDRRGVVATCNYPARKFGIHSAMAMSRALRLCPELVVLPVNMGLYKEVSRRIRNIFHRFTDLVEPVSLDEAYLDVTGNRLFQGSATLLAGEIRRRIFAEERLTASAGIAANKFLAKVASDWHKPNGQKVILPSQMEGFVRQLPVRKIPGVGQVTAARMAKLGLHTCGDLQGFAEEELISLFGSFGGRLYALCRGLDDRPVKTSRVRKSLSVEHTFAVDLRTREQGLAALPQLHERLMGRLAAAGKRGGKDCQTLFVKVKFSNFRQTTVQRPATEPELELYRELCGEALQRDSRPVRLLGLGVQFAAPAQQAEEDRSPRQVALQI